VCSTAVLITTLDEAASVYVLTRQLLEMGCAVIVSDGGSVDGTVKAARNAGALVLEAEQRLPIGPALIRAYERARYLGYERFVQMDAGGSHEPADLPALLAIDADVVVGSRFARGATYTGRPWRALLSRLMALACNLVTAGPWVRDWTSGYRVLSAAAVDELLRHTYRGTMHAWQMETLARLRAAGLSVVEMPITYTVGRSSASWQTVYEASDVLLHIFNHIGGPS
jgi:dolichol-phosphate mannosyltransferase